MDRPTKPSGRHAVRLRWDEIITRLSFRFNFLATRDQEANGFFKTVPWFIRVFRSGIVKLRGSSRAGRDILTQLEDRLGFARISDEQGSATTTDIGRQSRRERRSPGSAAPVRSPLDDRWRNAAGPAAALASGAHQRREAAEPGFVQRP